MTKRVYEKGRMMHDYRTGHSRQKKASQSIIQQVANQQRQNSSDEYRDGKIKPVLPVHQGISKKIACAIKTTVLRTLKKNPSNMSIEKPKPDVVGIAFPIHKAVMVSVVCGPLQRRVLAGSGAKEKIKEFN
jgi:hypothetical protein